MKGVKLGLVLGLLLVAGSHSLGADKFRIGTSPRLEPVKFLPIMAALDQKAWADQGIEAEWLPFESSIAMASAALAGSIDMGVHSVGGVIMAVSRKVPVIGVAKLADGSPFHIWVRRDSPIKEAKDLNNMKMGVTRLGDTPSAVTLGATRRLGLKVKLVALGSVPSMAAALRAGVVDAMASALFSQAKLEYEGVFRSVLDADQYTPYAHNSVFAYVPKRFLERQSALVKRGLTGLVRGARYAGENPAWSINAMMGQVGWPKELAKRISDVMRFSKDGVLDPRGIEELRDFLLEYKVISGPAPRLEDLYNPSLVPIS